MFDPEQLSSDEREIWDDWFPDGGPESPSQLDLWSLRYACMLLGGPGSDSEYLSRALDPASGRALREYKDARVAAWRAEQAAG